MIKKYQVFVSSTYQDLREERDQVIKSVLEMGHIPVGMEMFSAADEEQWKLITRQIKESDYYVLLVAHRYGSVSKEGISYTEKEYDFAVENGIPVLSFVIDDSSAWASDRHEKDAKAVAKLVKFKSKVKSKLIQFWSNKDDLHGKVSISLMKSITTNPRNGWIRASDIAGPDVINELARLSSENAALRAQIEQARRVKDAEGDDVKKAIHTLRGNSRRVAARTKVEPKWESAKLANCSLMDIFHWIAPNLINENSSNGVAQNIALQLVGSNYYKEWPVGKNVVSDVLADLAALDLVEPSKKKHPVSDTTSYWQLTKLGKQTLKEFRRVLLEEGLKTPESLSEEG
uniref:DUF4062 domain-containing protein n=1 Tax=Xanthomonas sp. 0924 TaxID=2835534 RepID=UPI003F7D60F8